MKIGSSSGRFALRPSGEQIYFLSFLNTFFLLLSHISFLFSPLSLGKLVVVVNCKAKKSNIIMEECLRGLISLSS